MPILFTSLPEELLERIIALAVLPPSVPIADAVLPASPPTCLPRSTSAPFPCRASAQTAIPRTTSLRVSSVNKRSVNRSTPLLISSIFARIGTALLYTHIHLTSRAQCTSLIRTLSTRSDLAKRAKSLRIEGAWPEVSDLLQTLRTAGSRLEIFDMVVCAPDRRETSATPVDIGVFCKALMLLPSFGTVKCLAVRKTSDAYLTLPGPASIIDCLSTIVGSWQSLETINIGFRLPSGPRRTLSSPQIPIIPGPASPCVKLVSALSHSPSLKIVCAQLPVAWNSSLLEISVNPSLTAIRLEPSPPVVGPHHLFLAEASKYPRLAGLIKAGSHPPPPLPRTRTEGTNTPGAILTTGRLRANTTLGTSSPPASTIAFPSTIPSDESADVPYTDSTQRGVSSHTVASSSGSTPVARQLSRRRSGKGHTRQTSKWSRRISVV